MSDPIACIVAYPSKTKDGNAAKFDMDYYLSKHMAIINKAWTPFGMKSWSVAIFKAEDSLDGSTPPYIVQATVLWDSVNDLKEALSKGSEESAKDVGNYTDVQPEIWVSKVTGTS